MTTRDWIINGVRVTVRVVVGHLVGVVAAVAAVWLGGRFGVTIDVDQLVGASQLAAEAAAIGATSAALLKLEARYPWLTRILSLGLKTAPPAYVTPARPAPDPTPMV